AHAGQLGGQPRILAFFADGQRQLIVRDDHDGRRLALRLRALIDRHRRYFGRRQRARHERSWIVRPLDDVDLLAAPLAADHLDPRAAQADTRADRIHVTLRRRHRDLGALAGFPRRRLDEDDALLDLRNLRLEESRQIAGMRPRERDLRSLGRPAYLENVRADPVAGVVALTGDLLALGQDRLGLADLENDVALLDAVDDPTEDLALFASELRVDALALGVPDFLKDDLLGRLRRDSPEILGRALLLDLELDIQIGLGVQLLRLREADLGLRVGHFLDDPLAQECRELTRLPVDLDTDVLGPGVRLTAGRLEGRLHRFKEDLLVDPLLPSDLLDDADQLPVHETCSLPEILR